MLEIQEDVLGIEKKAFKALSSCKWFFFHASQTGNLVRLLTRMDVV